MARLTHDAQSFLLDNRRIWLVGASIDYARVPPELWGDRIAAARQAGFNSVVTACPWMVHEPRQGRFSFSGAADVSKFVTLCRDARLYVGVRIGPFINRGYDGGGLPSWLRGLEGIRLRDASAPYMERVALYLRKLLAQISNLQVSQPGEGGVVFVQIEQSWRCTNDEVAHDYLGEVARHVRENGIHVPILTANDLWAEIPQAIETWQGADQLLVNLRQLRAINPRAPRIVSSFETTKPVAWGDAWSDTYPPHVLLHNFAQIMAAGAMGLADPFHAGTSFGFLGGRKSGRPDGFTTTVAAPAAPLGEAGARGEKYAVLKRLATFANHFGAVFAELDPDYHPVTATLRHVAGESRHSRDSRRSGDHGVAVVPLRGAAGRIVFVFGDPAAHGQSTTLLLDHGLPLTIELGDQPVGWFLIDVDIAGIARLDYANVCPFAVVDRSILVFFGPEKSQAHISINESMVEAAVPAGRKPRVIKHQDVTIVICNQKQIDATYVDDERVYVGAAGFDRENRPISASGFGEITVISANGVEQLPASRDVSSRRTSAGSTRSGSPTPTRLDGWLAAPATTQATGENARYASLAGPETLDNCGAPAGYGWYRVKLKVSSTKNRTVALPDVGNRMHLYLDGDLVGVVGPGPGGMGHVFDLKLSKGEHTLVGLADHLGRFDCGNDFGRRKGWYGHMYELKALRTTKPKVEDGEPVSPFSVRSFLLGQSKGRMTGERHTVCSFTYRRKAPVLLHVAGVSAPGLFLLNDEPLAWYAGALGETAMRMVLMPDELSNFKRGRNELRFAPDPDYDTGAQEMAAGLSLYECAETLTDGAEWSYARWEVPPTSHFRELTPTESRSIRKKPCWWRATFVPKTTDLPLWFNTQGLSKGQLFLNGENIGRYFTTTLTNARVGPQTRLYLPEPWIRPDQENEIILFDEHGFSPLRTKIEYRVAGELE